MSECSADSGYYPGTSTSDRDDPARLVGGAPSFVGIRSRVPWDEYVAMPGVSITRLKELDRSPLHYLYRLTSPKESAPLTLGRAAHAAVLEPERFEREFVQWTRRGDSGSLCPRKGQYWDSFVSANEGKTIITADEYELAVAIQQSVRSSADAMHYLASGDPEVTMQWLLDGRPCRGRADWLTTVAPPLGGDARPHVVGLKTARDCRGIKFGNQSAALGYPLQWGFYFDGYQTIKGCEPRMIEIVVEPVPPHAVSVFEIPQDVLDEGRDRYQALMQRLAECEFTGHFPGPQEHGEEVLSLPTYYYETADDLADIGLE